MNGLLPENHKGLQGNTKVHFVLPWRPLCPSVAKLSLEPFRTLLEIPGIAGRDRETPH